MGSEMCIRDRHAAWRGKHRLEKLLVELEFTNDGQFVASQLEEAVADINQAIADMRFDTHEMQHYEKH